MDTEAWIDNALTITNGLRQFHNAPPLDWSVECFEAAKKQANECQEQDRLFGGNTEGTSGTHGQNLFFSEEGVEDAGDIEQVIDSWYEFSESYTFSKPGPLPGSEFLTQLLWASSESFGLAASEDGSYVVANFFPAGNVRYRYDINVLLPEYTVPEDVERTGMLFGSFPPNNLVVRKVYPNTWAEEEDIKENDRFVAINGHWVTDMTKDDFSDLIKERPLKLRLHVGADAAAAKEEELVKVRERRGSVGRGTVELVADDSVEKIGMVMSLPPKPLVVRKVTEGGWADQKGIEPGDTFTEVNGRPVWEISTEEFMDILTTHQRPIIFRLATEKEQQAALKIQTIARGNSDRKAARAISRMSMTGEKFSVQDWRLARSRKARLERKEDQDRPQEEVDLQMTRTDLIARVFLALDDDKDQRLNEKELFIFARGLAFPDDTREWAQEFGDICQDFELERAEGIGFEDFEELVEEEGPYFCGYDRLNKVLMEDEEKAAAVKMQSVQRGRLARKRAAEMKEDQLKKEDSATKIQASFRGKKGRREALDKQNTKLQQDEADAQEKKRKADETKREAEEAKTKTAAEQKNAKEEAATKAAEENTKAAEEAAAKKEDEQKQKDAEEAAAKEAAEAAAEAEAAAAAGGGWFGWGGPADEPVEENKVAEGVDETAKVASAAKAEEKAKNSLPQKNQAAEKQKAAGSPKSQKQVPEKRNAKSPGPAPAAAKATPKQAASPSPASAKATPKQASKPVGNAKATAGYPPDKAGKQDDKGKNTPKGPTQEEDEAAAKIQSVARGRGARKDVDARSQVFLRYDTDQDGRLSEQEMLAFARCIGFNGSRQAWGQEYQALCAEHGWNPRVGLDTASFVWLTTNPEDQYWFDAAKLRTGGWEAAAGHSVEAEIPKPNAKPAQTPQSPQRGLEPLSPAQGLKELEVPMEAEITGLDWEQIATDEVLKASILQRICSTIAKKAGVNPEDLRVTLAPSPA